VPKQLQDFCNFEQINPWLAWDVTHQNIHAFLFVSSHSAHFHKKSIFFQVDLPDLKYLWIPAG